MPEPIMQYNASNYDNGQVWQKMTPTSVNSVTDKVPDSPDGDKTQVASKDEATKAQAVLEYSTLKGELQLRLHTNSMKLKQNSTIELQGLGVYLSGLYYVESVEYTLSADSAFSVVASVIKTGFGDSLKSKGDKSVPTVPEIPEQRFAVQQVHASGTVKTNPNGYVSTAPLRDTVSAPTEIPKLSESKNRFASIEAYNNSVLNRRSRSGNFKGTTFGGKK